MCGLLARRMGVDAERAELIAVASALHDVGKLAIPDVILNKPGPLTATERSRGRDPRRDRAPHAGGVRRAAARPRGADGPDPPRVGGRLGLPARAQRGRHPPRGTHRRGGRRLRRADQRPPVPSGLRGGRGDADDGAGPGHPVRSARLRRAARRPRRDPGGRRGGAGGGPRARGPPPPDLSGRWTSAASWPPISWRPTSTRTSPTPTGRPRGSTRPRRTPTRTWPIGIRTASDRDQAAGRPGARRDGATASAREAYERVARRAERGAHRARRRPPSGAGRPPTGWRRPSGATRWHGCATSPPPIRDRTAEARDDAADARDRRPRRGSV